MKKIAKKQRIINTIILFAMMITLLHHHTEDLNVNETESIATATQNTETTEVTDESTDDEKAEVVKHEVDIVSTSLTSGVSDVLSVNIADMETEIVEEEPTEPEVTETVLEEERNLYTTSPLNVRSGPGIEYDVIKVLNIGDSITVSAECDNGWYRINLDDTTYGYINQTYTSEEVPLIYLETAKITYYCPCALCCGWNTGITASGAKAVEGVTIATSSKYPFGTKLMIDGHVYTVQDRGGAGIENGAIDVYIESHERALQQGVHYSDIYLVVE